MPAIASDNSSASLAPVTASMVSVPLPSRMVCAVSLRSGRIAGPASSQPSPAAIRTVATPTAVYTGIRAGLSRMLSARMPTDMITPPCWSIGIVRTRYTTSLTRTFSVPGSNLGN